MPIKFYFFLVGASTLFLYYPFLDNQFVFDDLPFFKSTAVFQAAIIPFNLTPRTFPYFTLGFEELTWRSTEAHRIISLALHTSNSFLILKITETWLREICHTTKNDAIAIAGMASLLFALHPVAVYGAAYLIQRTILIATLFSLLSIWFYWKGLQNKGILNPLTAGLFCSLATFAKEHAIMLPFAVLTLTYLHNTSWQQNRYKAATFSAIAIPSALIVVLSAKGIIGNIYEPNAAIFSVSALENNSKTTLWLMSIGHQALLFFQYLGFWLYPKTERMSADIQITLDGSFHTLWFISSITPFCFFTLLAFFLFKKNGKYGLTGWGFMYFTLIYLTEFSSIRISEPFVLYRSYLWAPGIVFSCSALIARLNPNKPILFTGVLFIAIIFHQQSTNRLTSLRDEFSLWDDAAKKLPLEVTEGSARIFYNRGIQYLKQGDYISAKNDLDKVTLIIPNQTEGYLGRAQIYAAMGLPAEALEDLENAKSKTSKLALIGQIDFKRALIFSSLKNEVEAEKALALAAANGHKGAEMLIKKTLPAIGRVGTENQRN